MRGKRSKQYRKLMHAYALSFDFREPYQVLVDSEIIRDAERCKMKLGSMLQNTLHGQIKPMITQCCIRHLYTAQIEPAQRAQKEQWIEVAKQAERRRCGHHELDEPLSALECIRSVVDPKGSGSNKNRYVVATQDLEIREAMRQIAGVPLVYINRSVMILEPLAAKTSQVRTAEEISKRKAGLRGRQSLVAGEKRKREDGNDEVDAAQSKRNKTRGPKGPNPLSIKKAKRSDTQQSARGDGHNDQSTLQKVAQQQPPDHEQKEGSEQIDGSQTGRRRKRKRKSGPDKSGEPETGREPLDSSEAQDS